ncbi:MAG: hypothetical protein LQ352_006471 [Teloschistes flavicans]|nr:MAG: hypothetical protein LQ352_006471 [Teloschistes flavicans]
MFLYPVLILYLLQATHAAPSPISPLTLTQSNLTVTSRLNCVPISPLWESMIYYSDCLEAWDSLHDDRSGVIDRLYAFYTTSSGFAPAPGQESSSWKLPTSKTVGTCTLQIRMVRDFHARQLPLQHHPHEEYVQPALFPPAGLSTWSSILQDTKRVMDTCVRKGQPGFSANGFARTAEQEWEPVGIFVWGTGSAIAGEYRDDVAREVQGGGNASVATA